MDYTAMLKI